MISRIKAASVVRSGFLYATWYTFLENYGHFRKVTRGFNKGEKCLDKFMKNLYILGVQQCYNKYYKVEKITLD